MSPAVRSGSGERKNANPPPSLALLVAGLGEAKNAEAPMPLDLEPMGVSDDDGSGGKNPDPAPPQLAVDPMGVNGCCCFGDAAKNANANAAPLPLDTDGGANTLSAIAENDEPPPPPPPLPPVLVDRSPPDERAPGEALPGAGAVGVEAKGGSSSSILLRGEKGGKRQRRLRPTAQGSEKATGDWSAPSTRSSARWCACGVRKREREAAATSMASWVLSWLALAAASSSGCWVSCCCGSLGSLFVALR